MTTSEGLDNTRYHTVADVLEYGNRLRSGRPVCQDAETIDAGKAAIEVVMLALRTSRGLDLDRYRKEFGADASDCLERKAGQLERSGLLKRDGGRIRLSRRGFLIENEAVNRLFL